MADIPIYYVYRKDNFEYAGNGITFFDDAEYGCTEVPTPLDPFSDTSSTTVKFFWQPLTSEWLMIIYP